MEPNSGVPKKPAILMYVPPPTVALAGKPWEKLAASQFRNSNGGAWIGTVEVIFGFCGYQCFRLPELAAAVILVELADTRTQRLINLPGETLRLEEPTSGRHTSSPQRTAAPGILTPKTL